jgi:hypothetical protein
VVDLVHDQGHGLVAAAQDPCDLGIARQRAGAAVHHEQDRVGLLQRLPSVTLDRPLEALLRRRIEARRVHDQEPPRAGLDLGRDAVPGQTGRVLHQGPALAGIAVEERGLAHVGAPHDGHDGKGLGHVWVVHGLESAQEA